MSLRRLRFVLRAATAIYWIILFTATHLPPRHLPNTHIGDKIEHTAAYALLAALLCAVLSSRRSARAVIAIVVPVILAYAALDELTQPLVGRSCELNDWFADALGVSISVGIFLVVRIVRKTAR